MMTCVGLFAIIIFVIICCSKTSSGSMTIMTIGDDWADGVVRM